MLFLISMDIENTIGQGLDFYGMGKDKEVLKKLVFYVNELHRWNKKVNLTGIKDIEGIVTHLIYDAFFIAPMLGDVRSVMDLGSGAGILGIPMGILYPHISVFSVDKSQKKIQFQRYIKRSLFLFNFTTFHQRAESIESLHIDALLVKGFGAIDTILTVGGPHIKKGGRAYILKGEGQDPIQFEGYILEEDKRYEHPEGRRKGRLYIYRKL
ncbi:MAG: 16S rRNA (guanine(527)-N(7))-methyltransferase RsmG [Syntrophorhabdaceae bacterium]|nr:16S rRNA (guanine(527)-N(7))-methyltransferase RsmG [Syntrophorhabdaceae bacterium]